MKRRTRITLFVLVLLTGSTYAASCGDLVVQSVKTGLFAWVSGSVVNTFQTGQLNSFLNGLLAGGLTTPLP